MTGSLPPETGEDLHELCDRLLARMLPAEVDDDVALIAVRLHASPRRAQATSVRASAR